MSTAPRILVSGDVLGRLNQLFKRVESVTKATEPFDALLCVGQFFPESFDGLEELSDYLEGRSSVPIPTYFTGDYGAGAAQTCAKALKLPANRGFKTDGIEICRNLYWLRGSGKFTLHGLSVAYLAGRRSQQQFEGSQTIGQYTEDDVGALHALTEEPEIIDILLTNEWPAGITSGANATIASEQVLVASGCDPTVSELVSNIKPRYHFAGTNGVFFAREPYMNVNAAHVTRFIAVASVGNKNKQKFIHAISPTPAKIMVTSEIGARPPNTTVSPYIVEISKSRMVAKRSTDPEPDSQYWRYDVSAKRFKQGGDRSQRLCFKFTSSSCPGEQCHFLHDENARQRYSKNVCFDFLNKGTCERGPGCSYKHSLSEEDDDSSHGKQKAHKSSVRRNSERNCWFCLSSPNLESQLIITVAESYYCALAKGPLIHDHVLLVPIEHCPSTLAMSPKADAELLKFKNALKIYFKKTGKAIVFYEWISDRIAHANLQVIPFPLSRATDVKKAFKLASKNLGFEFSETEIDNNHAESVAKLRSKFDGKFGFFYAELPEGIVLSYAFKDQDKLPIQFGREVMAGMLNMADRADWRNCRLSREEEIKMVEGFKKGFDEFDPTK